MINTSGELDVSDLVELAERTVEALESITEELGRAADHASRIADELSDLNENLEQLHLPDSSGYLELDPAVVDELSKIRMAIQDGNRKASMQSRIV